MLADDEEELKVPEEMFKDVKFFVVGDIDPKVPCHPFRSFPPSPWSPPTPGGGDTVEWSGHHARARGSRRLTGKGREWGGARA